jgi:hypothetical protein
VSCSLACEWAGVRRPVEATGRPAGFTPGSSAPAVSTLTPPGSSITTVTAGSATSQTIAPYSIAMITLQPGSSSGGGTTAACHVAYSMQSQWTGGVTANVTLTNTGTTAWTGWSLGFTYPGDQRVTSSWNTGSLTQSGQSVTATNASYNGAVAAAASTSFGVQGTWTNSDAPPTSFTVNGAACS